MWLDWNPDADRGETIYVDFLVSYDNITASINTHKASIAHER